MSHGIDAVASTRAHAADLMLPSHMLVMLLLRSHEAAPATALSCGQRMRVDCSLGAHELGRHGMIPAHPEPRHSFHEAIPVADQLGQAAQLDQVRIFRIGFRSGLRRHAILQPSCAVALEEALRGLQVIPTKKHTLVEAIPRLRGGRVGGRARACDRRERGVRQE